jgi:hypothetical protein
MARGWDALDGLDTHPAFQISGRFGYSFGKTQYIKLFISQMTDRLPP